MIEDADRIIVDVTGVADWRPLFVLGLQAFMVGLVAAIAIALIVWWALR